MTAIAVPIVATLAFTLSASAGLGGSLILVPGLSLLLGPKEGVALAALLLAANNVVKVLAYRRTIPFRPAAGVVVLTALGAAIGARLLVAADEQVVAAAVGLGIVLALAVEVLPFRRNAPTPALSAVLAFGSGATSGFSGTSGPLKGVALRNLGLDRLHFVGAASLVSLVGDATKAAIYTEAQLLGAREWTLMAICLPLMLAATFTGRRITDRIGERAFLGLFWAVMAAYIARLAF